VKDLKPMLASPADFNILTFPKLASPKLDGIRCLVRDGVALSRHLLPIPNKFVQSVIGKKKWNGLDGELIVGPATAKDVLRVTTSGVMSVKGEPDFVFHVFDDWIMQRSYETRLEQIMFRVASLDARRTAAVVHEWVASMNGLATYEATQVGSGYEGVMLRDPNAGYKFGRSTAREQGLLKVKRFEDSEAIVTGIVEEMLNTNTAERDELGRTKRSKAKAGLVGKGTMGALNVRDIHTGVEFQIGSGFTAADRARTDWVGKVVKYKHFPLGVKDKPRLPVFLAVRDPLDMDVSKAVKSRMVRA
jgi:DNA ligase-1